MYEIILIDIEVASAVVITLVTMFVYLWQN